MRLYAIGVIEVRLTHPLTTDDIRKPTEEQLPDKGANGGCDLDTEVLVGAELLICLCGEHTSYNHSVKEDALWP